MSTQKRKISYWAIDFLSGDKHSFDPEIFKRFMTYINTLDQQSRLQREEKQHKAIALENVHEKKKQRNKAFTYMKLHLNPVSIIILPTICRV